MTTPYEEGCKVMQLTLDTFWDQNQQTFINKNKSDGSYDEKSGKYTLWAVAVAAQAIVDAARVNPEQFGPMIEPIFKVFDRYYTTEFGGSYCASENYDGNKDVYYDDNAQVASAFITGYEITGNMEYLEKSIAVFHFLETGWGKELPYGVRWHVDKPGSNVCSTAECGIAAMRISKHIKTPIVKKVMVSFATNCAKWVFDWCQDKEGDKLIFDGAKSDGKGWFVRDKAKWTYNQGTPLTLCCLLYKETKGSWFKEKAAELASAVTDRNTAIFDRDTANLEARYYRDSLFFYHLLAEGFADFVECFSSSCFPELIQRVRDEAVRELKYIYKYLRDPDCNLYFQNFELFRISEKLQKEYVKLTGTDKKFEPSSKEREHSDNDSISLKDRPLTHSLISCSAASRVFLQTMRISPYPIDNKQ